MIFKLLIIISLFLCFIFRNCLKRNYHLMYFLSFLFIILIIIIKSIFISKLKGQFIIIIITIINIIS